MTVLVQNVQSLKNKSHIIESFLLSKNISIACISETWIAQYQNKLLTFDTYEFAAEFNRCLRQGGGVAILLKQGIEFVEKIDIAELSKESVFECCAIEIPKENMLLVNIYRPGQEIETFFEQLHKLLYIIHTRYKTKKKL